MAKKKIFQISNALTEGLEETITAAHNYSGELRVEVIPIKKIDTDPENPRDLMLTLQDMFQGINERDEHHARKVEELTSLQTIANSIRDQGIINPIVVYKHGERYRLVAGERRTLASVLAGKADIQAKILETKPNDLKISLLQWIENVERSDLSLWERLRNLEKILDVYAQKKKINPEEITITELSSLIGCTKPHAMNYKAVIHADQKLRDLIKANKIRNLEKAALIANQTVANHKERLLDACLNGIPLKKLRTLAILENKKPKAKKPLASSRRGRQTTAINLGKTKNSQVAKVIIDAMAQHELINPFLGDIPDIDWSDFNSVNQAMRDILVRLEHAFS